MSHIVFGKVKLEFATLAATKIFENTKKENN